MKRFPLAVLVVVSFVHLTLPPPRAAAARQAAGPLAATLTELDTELTGDFVKDGIGSVSIGVVSGSGLIWSKHYGYADMEAKVAPTSDTAYRVGSITKQFTGLALLQLVEQGKLRLSDPVEKYLPEIKQVKKAVDGTPPITILQMATMYAGLSREPGCTNHSVGPVSRWQKIVLDCLPMTTYANEPGTAYLYSNIGYASLGLAIERAGGQPFVDHVTQRILTPLGMSRSAFEPTVTIRENLARGYQRLSGKPDRSVPDRELDGRGYRVPNGAMFSTVNDLAKFVAWELGDGPPGILSKTVQDANYRRAFFDDPTMAFGYGVGFVINRRGEIVLMGHDGSTPGYHSAAYVHRPSKLGVIVLRNVDVFGSQVNATQVATRFLARLVTTSRR